MWVSLCLKFRTDLEKQEDQFKWFMGLATAIVAKYIMIRAYNYLLFKKALIDMKGLPQDQKKVIWETAKDFAGGKLNKKELIEFCECLYLFEYILNLK